MRLDWSLVKVISRRKTEFSQARKAFSRSSSLFLLPPPRTAIGVSRRRALPLPFRPFPPFRYPPTLRFTVSLLFAAVAAVDSSSSPSSLPDGIRAREKWRQVRREPVINFSPSRFSFRFISLYLGARINGIFIYGRKYDCENNIECIRRRSLIIPR